LSVYTNLSEEEIGRYAESAGLGKVLSAAPVSDGIENTIYRVETERGTFILTLFESADDERVRDIGRILSALAARGVKVVAPLGDIIIHRGKPLLFFPFVKGLQPAKPTKENLRSLGREVATLHLGGVGLEEKVSPRKLSGRHLAEKLLPEVSKEANIYPEYTDFLLTEALYQSRVPEESLPGGLIHADLFPDNLIFGAQKGEVKAILDFALAGYGPYLFDVCVALLACVYLVTSDSEEREVMSKILLEGYESVRALEAGERELIVPYIRRAALRYLCMRLERGRRPSESGVVKDPEELLRVIESFK